MLLDSELLRHAAVKGHSAPVRMDAQGIEQDRSFSIMSLTDDDPTGPQSKAVGD
jgi:hypothetical protein